MLATIRVCLVHRPIRSKVKMQILVFFVMLDHTGQDKRVCLPALAGQCARPSLSGHAPALPLKLCCVSAAPLLAATPPTPQAFLYTHILYTCIETQKRHPFTGTAGSQAGEACCGSASVLSCIHAAHQVEWLGYNSAATCTQSTPLCGGGGGGGGGGREEEEEESLYLQTDK